jgi:glutaredoxin
MTAKKITLYSLTTCGFCQAIKKMLDDLGITFENLQADDLPEKEKEKVIRDLKKVNPKCSFPTVVIDEKVIVGYKIQEIKETIGIHTEVDELYDKLKKIHEPKGYYLNGNKEKPLSCCAAF